ncbi:NUDIX hydrolase [Endozoicomonas sp. OPT23]|uniref:NUDIX hydrolase n=1 Tax=Endozoicomonas sp. OPT23 TaxID=2072845 RepID=UPI001D9C8FCD|nr:NUDIX hydrolase [Endozoicomonas sp. OPT23]
MNYCSDCGAKVSRRTPEGDNRVRDVCDSCGIIHYQNPLIVAGTLPVYKDKVLLCKRAIEPRKGYWTLPGGFMELGETLEQGALRETWEEAGARVNIESLYTLFNIVHVGQLSVFFLAKLPEPDFFAGEESSEVRLFSEDEIPWDELAFNTIRKTLRHYFVDRQSGNFEQKIEDIQVVQQVKKVAQ